mmetsp:Transcript_2148/g.3215  ORF Transcript_2148/g.3215 Transcript_2148/m.3215 type:complete len:142 (+) Transcript_2148:253-678(+)
MLVLILLSIIPMALEYWEIAAGGRREFLIRDDPIVIDDDKYTLAKEFVTERTGLADSPLRSESGPLSFLLFTNKGDSEYGLLEKDTLVKIEQIEKLVSGHENYTQVCLATSNVDSSCNARAFQSPLAVFYATGVTDISALT